MQYDGTTGNSEIHAIVYRACFFAWMIVVCIPIAAQDPELQHDARVFEHVPISTLDPGTQVMDGSEGASWNRQVLVASSKINSGDVNSVSSSIRNAATKCSLTLMAAVEKSNDLQRYELVRIGAGYSIEGPAGRIIISSDTASQLGVPLGFIARQVLRTNEQQLAKVSVVAQTSLMAVFDAPSVMHRKGTHRKYLTRHFVYFDQSSGEGAMMTWLLAPPTDEDLSMAIINQPIRGTKWGIYETRNIHVDADEFNFLGVPGELAFALEDLPPGVDITWTKRAADVAGKKSFTEVELQELSDALREALELTK